MNQRKEYALKLAAKGFYIAPLQPGSKSPFKGFGNSWKDLRTKDPKKIEFYFERMPDMNYCVSAGDNFVIIDLDVKDINGIDRFKSMGDPEETFIVDTPTGGQHWYYRSAYPVNNSAKHFGDGIDIRGTSGYVVGPGCVLFDENTGEILGEYKKSKESISEVAQAPDWVQSKCVKANYSKPEEYVDRDPVDIADVRDALRHLNPDCSRQEWIETMLSLKATKIVDLDGEDLDSRDVAEEWSRGDYQNEESIKYDPSDFDYQWDHCGGAKEHGRNWGSLVYDAMQNGYAGKYADSFLKKEKKEQDLDKAWEEVDLTIYGAEDHDEDDSELKEANATDKWLNKIYIGDGIKKIKRADHLIYEWLPDRGVTGLIAYRSHGKTVVMLDLALRLALCNEKHKIQWGHTPLPENRVIIYMCGEDPENTAYNHVKAWLQENNKGKYPKRFVFIDGVPNLLKMDDSAGLLKAIGQRLNDEGFNVNKDKFVVFFDTWQRGTIGLSQLDEEDMSTAVTNAEQIGKKLSNAPIIIAFHPPKSAKKDKNNLTISGTGQLENVTTALWHLYPADVDKLPVINVTLEVDRIKGPGAGNVRDLLYKVVEVKDDNGDTEVHKTSKTPITGIVVQCQSDRTPSEAEEARRKENEKKLDKMIALIKKVLNDETLQTNIDYMKVSVVYSFMQKNHGKALRAFGTYGNDKGRRWREKLEPGLAHDNELGIRGDNGIPYYFVHKAGLGDGIKMEDVKIDEESEDLSKLIKL